jgi:hypothetical protein
MWFLLLSVVSAQPFYKDTLRQLPNKLRQERIHAKVHEEIGRLEHKILDEAGHNQTEVNFTLFCMDPNLQYRENQLYNKYLGRIPEGLVRTPRYSIISGYIPRGYVYQRDGPHYRFSSTHWQKMETEKETELIYPRPPCNPKHGYELYQRNPGTLGPLEDTPQAYTKIFFLLLNKIFPDLHMTVTDKRPSEGLYDADCCPLYTVSW